MRLSHQPHSLIIDIGLRKFTLKDILKAVLGYKTNKGPEISSPLLLAIYVV